MPLYEYQCEACQHRFERIQKFSDELVSTCPECEGPVRKLVSSPAIQFKGTGWYITDYARSGKEGAAEKSEQQESASEGSSDKDTKNATDSSKKSGSGDSSSSGSGDSSSSSTSSSS